jgi:hypothetical protein
MRQNIRNAEQKSDLGNAHQNSIAVKKMRNAAHAQLLIGILPNSS